jgi:hypothetical protein
MEKSYVTIEQKVCPICGKTYDSGDILLDTRLKETFEHYTVTGMQICSDCKELAKDRIALIVATAPNEYVTVKPEDANRTGEILWMRRDAAKEIFINLPEKELDREMMFINPDAAEKLKQLIADAKN